MNKKLIFALFLIVIMMFCFVGCNNQEQLNPIKNGNFELSSDVDGTLSINEWKKSSGSEFYFKTNRNDGSEEYREQLGTRYAFLTLGSGSKANDYLYQTIKLDKNKTYKLSADIFIDNITPSNKIGAKIAFLEDQNFEGINITVVNSEWTTYEYYFTSATSKEMTLTVGFGDTNNKVYGSAGFDNIKLQIVNSVPDDYTKTLGILKHGDDYSLSDGTSNFAVVCLAILTLVMAIAIYFGLRNCASKDQTFKQKNTNVFTNHLAMFVYLVFGAFLVRFIITICCYGMGENVDHLIEIGKLISENSILSFYPTLMQSDSLGIVYLMGILGSLAKVLNIQVASLGYSILVRTPAIIMDIIAVYMIYSYASKYQNEKQGLIFGAMYAFMPIFFIFGTLNGSTEGIAIALLIIMFMGLLEKNYIKSGVLYTIALMFSNYCLLILPIILIFQIYGLVKDKENRMTIALTMLLSFLFFFGMTITLTLSELQKGNVLYYFKVMYNTFKETAFLNKDTFNIYAVFGMANKVSRTTFMEVFNWLFIISLSCVSLYHFITSKNRLDIILLSAVSFISYSIIGANAQVQILPIGIALLLIYIVLVQEERLYWIFSGLSFLSVLNIASIIARSGYITGSSSAKYLAFASTNGFLITFSIFAVALLCYLLYVSIDIIFYSSINTIQPMKYGFKQTITDFFKFGWIKNIFKNNNKKASKQ